MAKPTKKPEVATNDIVEPISGQNNKVEPNQALKDDGFYYKQKPPFNWFNWIFNNIKLWIDYFETTTDTLDTTTVKLTGNQSVAGVKTFTNTTESTTKDTGSMILEGGLGVEKNIFAGGLVSTKQMLLGVTTAVSVNSTGETVFGLTELYNSTGSTISGGNTLLLETGKYLVSGCFSMTNTNNTGTTAGTITLYRKNNTPATIGQSTTVETNVASIIKGACVIGKTIVVSTSDQIDVRLLASMSNGAVGVAIGTGSSGSSTILFTKVL